MKRYVTFLIGFGFILHLFGDQVSYSWPLWPIPEGQRVSSNFCDYRPAYDNVQRHLHEGIDIPVSSGESKTVFPITLVFEVLDTLYRSHGWIVKVRHYEDDATALVEGSRYIHMDAIDDLEYNVVYVGDAISQGTTFWGDHLHLEYRKGGSYGLERPINPFFISELCPEDNTPPILKHLYVDFENYGDADVCCWDGFLNHYFWQYYSEVTYSGTTYAKLELPSETAYNDLDDPHIIISDSQKVYFVLHAWDEVTSTGTDNAPYSIKVYLDKCPLYVGEGECVYEAVFDSLNKNDCHEEEDIYSTDEPMASGWGTEQYYRLYKKDINSNDTIPYCIKIGSGTSITEDLDEGIHKIRIVLTDHKGTQITGNQKTADVWFYIQKTNPWLNFFREE